ncbi:MAG: hypothetical protein HC853_18505, partial [Anaerolineae bacterium]|nr:hypothetical protein [Anaerolineae bacterium]
MAPAPPITNGRYSFSFCDDDGWFDDELELYIQVQARIYRNGKYVVAVEDDGVIDDIYEFKSTITKSSGGSYTRDLRATVFQSEVLNIADAVYEGWQMWNDHGGAKGDDAIFDSEAEVHYEPGENHKNSFYNDKFLTGGNVFNNDDITVADDPSDPDPWDDGVILHEWAHMADDHYSCDDPVYESHSLTGNLGDRELAWSEAWGDYYQSATRHYFKHRDPSYYLDVNGSGNAGISVDLETFDATYATRGADVEGAIAAMLWDFYDTNDDPRVPAMGATPATGPWDKVAHGHRAIQEVMTDPTFESNGDIFDDTCTVYSFLEAWEKLGKPTNKDTSEVVVRNANISNFFRNPTGLVVAQSAQTTQPAQPNAPELGLVGPDGRDVRWWKQLTM